MAAYLTNRNNSLVGNLRAMGDLHEFTSVLQYSVSELVSFQNFKVVYLAPRIQRYEFLEFKYHKFCHRYARVTTMRLQI